MQLEAYRFPDPVGGNLCLDFTNTTEFRDSDRCLEFLRSYDHLLAWCWYSKLIDEGEAARLSALAANRPAEAEAAFQKAIQLREMFYHIFTAVIAKEFPGFGNLVLLNQTLSTTLGQRRIGVTDDGDEFDWVWHRSDDLASVLAPIVLAGADLLTSDQLQHVRQCPNCGWLFVDTSRNHSRRWCSMDFCGSKIKSRRQYERRKTATKN